MNKFNSTYATMWLKFALTTACSLLCACTGALAEDGTQPEPELAEFLQPIKTAKRIEECTRAQPKSDLTEAFAKAKEKGASIRTQLDWLTQNATPAGRLYAALLIKKIDNPAGKSVFEQMKSDKSLVEYRNGGVSCHYTVGEIAIDLMSPKPIINFDPLPATR